MEVSRQIKVPVEARGCCPRLHQASAVANYSPTDNFLPESAAAMILLDEVQGWQGVGERQFWWHPWLSWSPYVLKFLQRCDMSVDDGLLCLKPFPLSSLSTIRNLRFFFCFAFLTTTSGCVPTLNFQVPKIKRKQDKTFDKMYVKALTYHCLSLMHYTHTSSSLHVQKTYGLNRKKILIIELYNTTSVFLGDTKCYWPARVLQCESCFLIYK